MAKKEIDNKEKKKWYKSPSNWLIIVACIILVPILIMNIWIMVQSRLHEDKIPDIFGYKPFIVLSGSMETAIHEGDLIITKIVEPETLKVNDIIAFRDEDNTVTTHRIIDIVIEDTGESYFITKGDSNNTQDQSLVSLDSVEGVYVMRIPGFGSIMDTLAKPTTIIIILLLITMIFIIGFVISTKKQRILEHEEFLEYKKMHEELTNKKKEKDEEDKTEEKEEIKKEPVKKNSSSSNKNNSKSKKTK